jgi:hypothetical protein
LIQSSLLISFPEESTFQEIIKVSAQNHSNLECEVYGPGTLVICKFVGKQKLYEKSSLYYEECYVTIDDLKSSVMCILF